MPKASKIVLPRRERRKAYVQRVTALKLIAARARFMRARGLNGLEIPLKDAPILCADTTVALG